MIWLNKYIMNSAMWIAIGAMMCAHVCVLHTEAPLHYLMIPAVVTLFTL